MVFNTAPLWALLAFLYLTTAVYYEVRHRQQTPSKATGLFLLVGFAIVIASNRRAYFTDEWMLFMTEMVLIVCLAAAWVFGILMVHEYVEMRRDQESLCL